MNHQTPNNTSPYLLQHAQQTINWYPWSEEPFHQAKEKNKPILLSIGYASCHWCHVMSEECFENQTIAQTMNVHFINIKVDRQEHPEVDLMAISAMQTMGLAVGWPLHLFLLPNQQPFYGGTYFPRKDWHNLLLQIAHAFENHQATLSHSALQLTQSIHKQITLTYPQETLTAPLPLHPQTVFEKLDPFLDHQQGGLAGEPKFLMPSISLFLLTYYQTSKDQRALDQINRTLIHQAYGAIYDHLRGGFFRYTTDANWQVPHFEKMLDDNAQMVNLYAQAYQLTQAAFYKEILSQTLRFLETTFYQPEGFFAASLDADSQGQEGGYYTWTYNEIASILAEEMDYFAKHFDVSMTGNWQNNLTILYKKAPSNKRIEEDMLDNKLKILQNRLAQAASQRIPPAVDEQLITSWNAMMIDALVEAYYVLKEPQWLNLALQTAQYIVQNLMDNSHIFHSSYKGKKSSLGYLGDYAWLIKALINLYQATLDETWLTKAENLTHYTLTHFKDEKSTLFYYVQKGQPTFLKNPREIFDQVTPSSNAIMVENLFYLALLTENLTYQTCGENLLKAIKLTLFTEPAYMSHWANVYTKYYHGLITVTLSGPDQLKWAKVIKTTYSTTIIKAAKAEINPTPCIQKQTTCAYLCHKKSCAGPFDKLERVIEKIEEHQKIKTSIQHTNLPI